jgi:hypothetical protein
MGEDGFQSICEDFGDYFVDHIVKANWAEIGDFLWDGNFWNQGDVGMVYGF